MNGVEIYLGGDLVVVSHGSADDAEGDVLRLRYACPAVAGDIEGDGGGDAGKLAYGFQLAVDAVELVVVLLHLVAVFIEDDGKEVAGGGVGVSVEDGPHLLFDVDGERAVGLVADIGDGVTSEVGLAEEGEVYE